MTFPHDALSQHIAVLGKTGSGKTYAAKGLVEAMLEERRQVCVLDPTSAWWGLRLSRDGKAKGFDVVLLGGQHGDIPLSERSGDAVARLVTEQGASVVIDTSGMTVGEYTRWFIDFAGTLYTTIREPLHLVIDEAHHFMPQGKAPDPQAGKMLHAGNRLMSGGRSLGIRGMLITQRPAKLHKDSLTCADTLIAMRVLSPQDRKAIREWIDGCGDAEQGKAVLDSLAGLKRGEGWVWYPEGEYLERTKFGAISTYDSSATPKHGKRRAVNVGQIDLAAVKDALAEAVKEAEANDPKLLKKRIAELERQVAAKGGVDEAEHRQAVQERDRAIQRSALCIAEVRQIVEDMAAPLRRAQMLVEDAPESKAPTNATPSGVAAGRATHAPARTPQRETAAAPSSNGHALGGGALRMVQALVDRAPAGFTEAQWATMSRLKRSGGTWSTYKSRLRQAGLVECEGELWRATPEAVAEHGDPTRAPATPAEEREAWKSRLGRGPARMINALTEEPMSREELAEAVGLEVSGGTFGTYLSRLRSNGVIEERDGVIALVEALA